MLSWRELVSCSLDFRRVDMADPEGVEAQGQRVREVGRVEDCV